MTPEQQRIAIAEACGWTYKSAVNFWERNDQLVHGDKGQPTYLPNYLNDLNAMHEAEKVLTNEQLEVYCNILHKPNHGVYWAIHATAAQRAEAFLRTIGKWEESK
jgi:hypothetical protein